MQLAQRACPSRRIPRATAHLNSNRHPYLTLPHLTAASAAWAYRPKQMGRLLCCWSVRRPAKSSDFKREQGGSAAPPQAARPTPPCWPRTRQLNTPCNKPCWPSLHSIELHDAFAVQGLSFAQALGLNPERLNPRGGGLARGHPIGASGAIALVQLLANMTLDAPMGGLGLVAVAGAGGVGAAAVVEAHSPANTP